MIKRLLLFISFIVITSLCSPLTASAQNSPELIDPWWSSDKVPHLLLSFSLGFCSYNALWTLGEPITRDPPGLRLLLSAGLSLVPGLMKEIYDSGQPLGNFSWRDLTWDAAGAFLGSATMWAVELWKIRQPRTGYAVGLRLFGRGIALDAVF